MDGRVGAIRAALDEDGLTDTPIIGLHAPSTPRAFYGPFREAADSTPASGDRRGYQMDPANGREAVREAQLDVDEGADMLMVKPALPYLDVIRRVKRCHRRCRSPPTTSAASTAMVKAAAPGRLARRAGRRARDADLDPPRRRRHRHHLLREGRRPMASERDRHSPKLRSRKDGAAIPLDDTDRALMNLMQWLVPARPASPYAAVAARGGADRGRGAARDGSACSTTGSSARSRRSSTPARSATTRCSSPPRSTPSTRSGPAKIINSHPGVSHNYLRNHEFNLWFTIAIAPDSRARPRRARSTSSRS